jgi:hypothetical protein
VGLVACGGGGDHSGVATGPSQSPGPPTTPAATSAPPPTSTATAVPSASATAGATATAAATATPDPATAVAKVGETLYPSAQRYACGANSGRYDSCPVTQRLAARLDSHPTTGAEPLCRCQGFWQQSQVSATRTADAGVWFVHVVLDFGQPPLVKIDVLVRATPSGWQADDTTCTGGGSSTSIYVQNPPPCFSS